MVYTLRNNWNIATACLRYMMLPCIIMIIQFGIFFLSSFFVWCNRNIPAADQVPGLLKLRSSNSHSYVTNAIPSWAVAMPVQYESDTQ